MFLTSITNIFATSGSGSGSASPSYILHWRWRKIKNTALASWETQLKWIWIWYIVTGKEANTLCFEGDLKLFGKRETNRLEVSTPPPTHTPTQRKVQHRGKHAFLFVCLGQRRLVPKNYYCQASGNRWLPRIRIEWETSVLGTNQLKRDIFSAHVNDRPDHGITSITASTMESSQMPIYQGRTNN
jgi:hypothetical protein